MESNARLEGIEPPAFGFEGRGARKSLRNDNETSRFWSKVDKNGPTVRQELGPCWLWTAGRDQDGYGFFYGAGRRRIRAHRFARILAGDDVSGRVVRHECDNPPCTNPAHLVTGTVEENVADRQAKGRGQKGETNHSARLTALQVIDIRRRAAGMGKGRNVRLASEYGVHPRTISHVVRGTNWRHLDLTHAEHDRLHWLAGEVIAGRLTLAEAERLAVRL